jgi:hypothetical protein
VSARWEISINSDAATATWKHARQVIFGKSVWPESRRVTELDEGINPTTNESAPNQRNETPKRGANRKKPKPKAKQLKAGNSLVPELSVYSRCEKLAEA